MEEDIKAIQEYIEYDKEHRIVTVFDKKPLFRDRLENLLKRYKELEEEVESQDKTIDKLVEEQEEREKYTHSLEEENEQLKNEGIKKWLKEVKDCIPISVIQNKIDELTKYRDLAKEQIEERVVIADSDSLNYGRAEAHDKDIQVLQKLLEERNK